MAYLEKEGITIDLLKKLGLRKNNDNSKNVAKERLQFILVQDRIQLSPGELSSLKVDLIEVLQEYIDLDDEEIDMEINRDNGMMALVANFPLKRSN